jgi:hypothetical protein
MMVEHKSADQVTSEFNRRCQNDVRFRRVMSTAPIPAFIRTAYDMTLRPFFADQSVMETLGIDLSELLNIAVSLPSRLFDANLNAYCSAIGLDEERTALVCRLPHAMPPTSGRADLYRVGSQFKLLEFNVNTGLGGADISQVQHALMNSDPFAGFAAEFGLSYMDTMASKADLLRQAASAVSEGREPFIAAVEADGTISTWENTFRSIQASLKQYGVDLAFGELSQLERKNGRVYLDGRPIDLMLRYFMVDQIVGDAVAQATYEMVCQVSEEGGLVLHTPPISHLSQNKAAIALLSDQRYRNAFSRTERELIDRIVPWTRLLREGTSEFGDERVDLMRFAVAHRRELILKPNAGQGGRGIVAGWETEERAWTDVLRQSVGGPFIIQHRVEPTPELVAHPDSGQLESVMPAWGVFFSENGFDGAFIRTAPSAIIGSPGTKRNALFTT